MRKPVSPASAFTVMGVFMGGWPVVEVIARDCCNSTLGAMYT